jgi:hypothetical protein
MPTTPSHCDNVRCCRGVRHPQEDMASPNDKFMCRNCGNEINRMNLGQDGGCRLCGDCASLMKRCGHCGRPFTISNN